MPNVQVLDLSPTPRPQKPLSPLEVLVKGFTERNAERNELSALKDLYDKNEKEGGGIEKLYKNIQTDPRLGPTTRANSMKNALDFEKFNREEREAIKKKMDAETKKANEAKIIRDREIELGQEPGSLSHYEGNIAKLPKPAKGTLTDRPFDPEQQNFIEKVRSTDEYKKGDLIQKQNLLIQGNVSPSNITRLMDTEIAQDKNDARNQKYKQETRIKVDAITKDYDDSIAKESKAAKNQMEAARAISKSIDEVAPTDLANLFKFFGDTGKRLSDAMLSGKQAKIQASIPNFLEGRKELFGVRLSDADLALLSDKLPDIGKSPEANKAILGLMEKYSERAILREEVGRKIKKANEGYRPRNYQDEVEETVDEMVKPVQVISPNTGKKIKIPAYKLQDAIIGGATLVNE